jgi:branched-chain amino acid transport system substrate-binding protein
MRRLLLIAALAASIGQPTHAENAPIKLGVLTDMNGPLGYLTGEGSVEAARLAVEDMHGQVLGRPVQILSADQQSKPDVGSLIARQWYDSGVDVILDVPNSAVALAVASVAKNAHKLALISGAATDALTEESCNDHTLQWGLDSYSEASAVVPLIEHGAKTFYLEVADYAFGHTQERAARAQIAKLGATVVGSVSFPADTDDYSSFLLRAQASHAEVVELLLSGGQTLVNAFKQAKEFGLTQGGQRVATLHVYINDVHTLGLDKLAGLQFLVSSYWDTDDETRAFAKRFYARRGHMPSEIQSAVYSTTYQYLKAVQAAGTTDADKVLAQLRSMPIDDMYSRHGKLLANGRLIHDMYLVEIKTPEESKYPWDYFKILQVVPGEKAFRPLSESKCPLLVKSDSKPQ